MTSAFATKLATLAYGLSEWLLEYYAGTRCFARLNFDNCDALTDVQAGEEGKDAPKGKRRKKAVCMT